MMNNKSKPKIFTIATIFVLAFSTILFVLPATTAQEPQSKTTYPYINAVPNPVGVNQEVLLHVGITDPIQLQVLGWENLSVNVTDPNGDSYVLFENIKTDSTGGTGRVFVPTIVGTWYLQTHFPEQPSPVDVHRGDVVIPEGTIMEESWSPVLELVVQSDPVPSYPGFNLPTEYWTRPIDAQIREWQSIAASWLTPSGSWPSAPEIMYAPYNDDAPDTAHILWAKPFTQGGLVGGTLGDTSLEALGFHGFEGGDAYEGKWLYSLIVSGKLYYQKYSSVERYKKYACVDLHTGEELWTKVFPGNQTIDFAQLMYWDTYDFHGVYDYLWINVGSTWNAYDAYTGDWVYTMTNAPSGTRATGPKGEILIYTVNLQDGWMTLWNSSNVIDLYGSTDRTTETGQFAWGQWRAMGRTVNATGPTDVTHVTPLGLNGYMWNKTIAQGLPGQVGAVFPQDKVVGGRLTHTEVNLWGISLSSGHEGTLLFNKTWTPPAYWDEGTVNIGGFSGQGFGGGGFWGGWAGWSSEDKVAVALVKDTVEFYGFNLTNGDNIWGPTDRENYLNSFAHNTAIAYGRLFSSGTSGIVYAYNVTTGENLWTYEAKDPYNEFLFSNDWWSRIQFVTDGKVYFGHEEHSPIDPKPRGAPYYALDAATGQVVWRADGLFRQTEWGGRSIIGDSIIATQDTYSQQVFAIGKGPSSTAVSIQSDVVTQGNSVLIKGKVTDESPGTKDYGLMARFPDGVPAIADEDMSDWMLYVYKQFPRPEDAVGVPVKLMAIDPNNNEIPIGTTITNIDGNFGFLWTPDIPGKYEIFATFGGSGSYYGSHATTFVGVDSASSGGGIEPEPSTSPGSSPGESPSPSPTATASPSPSAGLRAPFPTEIAIAAAVVVAAGIGLVAYWILRKR